MDITVYAVTATNPKMDKNRDGKLPRVELGKFFKPKAADDFVAKLPNSWTSVKVEPRTERAEDQHPAHQAQGKAKAAWE